MTVRDTLQRREAIFEFITNYHREHGYGPSMREVADACGITSSSIVHGHIERLVADGMLRRTPGIARSYRPA